MNCNISMKNVFNYFIPYFFKKSKNGSYYHETLRINFLNLFKISKVIQYLLFYKNKINLYLCPNNYNLSLAFSFINTCENNFNIIFYDQYRTTIKDVKSNIIFLKINKFFNRFLFFCFAFIIHSGNIFLPHTKGGRLQKFIIKNFNISILEDGLDSYRTIPKNININYLKKDTKIIMPKQFKNYNAEWVRLFNINYIDINPDITLPIILNQFSKNNFDIDGYNITIESPGVDLCPGFEKSELFLPHPNPLKNNLKLNPKTQIISPEEATFFIKNNNNNRQRIFVGETMILIYLLNTIHEYSLRNLEVGLKKEVFKNLMPLLKSFLNHPRIKFSVN